MNARVFAKTQFGHTAKAVHTQIKAIQRRAERTAPPLRGEPERIEFTGKGIRAVMLIHDDLDNSRAIVNSRWDAVHGGISFQASLNATRDMRWCAVIWAMLQQMRGVIGLLGFTITVLRIFKPQQCKTTRIDRPPLECRPHVMPIAPSF